MTENVVYLPLKKIHFDRIKQGIKNKEYRRNVPYWRKRILEKQPCHAILRLGYTNTTMIYEIQRIEETKKMIILHLGNRIDESKKS